MKLKGIDMIKGKVFTNKESSVIGDTPVQFENLSDEDKEKLNDTKSKMGDNKITTEIEVDIIDLLNSSEWSFTPSAE